MAQMRKFKIEKDYVQVPNETARAVEKTAEKPISLQALGLITTLMSYSDNWELHKTELYHRFAKHKKTAVSSAWDDLVDAGYILEYKVRNGRENDYIYYYQIIPFTDEMKQQADAEILEEYGSFSGLGFQELKISTSKSAPENQQLLKKEKLTKEKEIKEKEIKTTTTTNNSKIPLDSKTSEEQPKTILVSSSEMASIDSILSKTFSEVPYEEIKTKLILDAKAGTVKMKTKEQYQALISSRIDFWLQVNKPAENSPLPETDSSDIAFKREQIKTKMYQQLEIMRKSDKSPQEKQAAKKEIERLSTLLLSDQE